MNGGWFNNEREHYIMKENIPSHLHMDSVITIHCVNVLKCI